MNVPHLDLFLSLMGAVGGTFLGLIYLPLADLTVRKHKEGGYRSWRVALPIISLLFGIAGFFVGTTVSLKEIIAALRDDHNKES